MRCRGGWYGVGFGRARHGRRRPSEEDIALLIASVLADGPRLGAEVLLELEERSRGRVRAEPERVYPLLQYLVDRDLVRVEEVEGKTRYQLTAEGTQLLEARRRRVERLWGRSRRRRVDVEDEIETAVASACASVESALDEVGRALDDIAGAIFGAPRRRRGRPEGGRHRGTDRRGSTS